MLQVLVYESSFLDNTNSGSRKRKEDPRPNNYKEEQKMSKDKNDNKNDGIDTQWMSPDDYIYLSKQAKKEGKKEITDEDFRKYLLDKQWKK